MKFVLSCVNSLVSFVGYDLAARQAFWYCPADRLRACGAAYDGDGLLIASDNTLIREIICSAVSLPSIDPA